MSLKRFDIAARYPAVLMSVFVCFTFSAGMPLLAPIGFVSVLLFYWVEKFLLCVPPPSLPNLLWSTYVLAHQ